MGVYTSIIIRIPVELGVTKKSSLRHTLLLVQLNAMAKLCRLIVMQESGSWVCLATVSCPHINKSNRFFNRYHLCGNVKPGCHYSVQAATACLGFLNFPLKLALSYRISADKTCCPYDNFKPRMAAC